MDREGRGGPDWSDGENEVDEGIREDPDVGVGKWRREDLLRLDGAGLAEETRQRMVLVAEEGDYSEAEEQRKLL